MASYNLGDGATIATYFDTDRGLTQYSITVRKGRFLATIDGHSHEVVARLAQFLLTEMSK